MKNIPTLRFLEFTDTWSEKKLGELGEFFKGAGISKADLSNEGTKCILYGELYTKYGEIIRDVFSRTNLKDNNLVLGNKNDVLIPSSGESAIDIATASCLQENNVLLGGDLNVFRSSKINGIFLSYQLNNSKRKEISKLAQGASVVHLYNQQLKKLIVNIPSIKEQDKISKLLYLIDYKIEKQKKKIDLLELKNKAIKEEIFAKRVRFKDDDGNDFEEWEEVELSVILKERKEYSVKEDVYPHVTLSKDGIYDKGERYNRDFLVRTDDKKYKVTKKNDICYNPANLKFGVISINKYGNAIFSPIYITFEVNKNYDPNFMGYYVSRFNFINKVRKYEEGTVYERMAVKPEDFLKYKGKFPSIKEQRKISKYLDIFIKKINLEKNKLVMLERYKKALIQGLFI